MIIILYSLLTLILVFITANVYVINGIFALVLINFFLYKNNAKKFILKTISVLPFYITLFILYIFFYNQGRVEYIAGIKIYISGLYLGLDIFIRCFLITIFVFSLNLTKIMGYVLHGISITLGNVYFFRRIFNIIFLSIYFIELFMEKLTQKSDKGKIKNFMSFVKNTLLDIEKKITQAPTNNLPNQRENRVLLKKNILMFSLLIILLIYNVFDGRFFEKLF